ncbi:hypothetical protein RRG08_012259 [Elysia crispata]|uniref:Antistasin-like domain-containing protein n=1 Tax=Elysia crispata TaxID=231223 RepID=A0AAE1BB22_9GAST|nr:hypothetical protein RRG08_012259 [Elysia crispata]
MDLGLYTLAMVAALCFLKSCEDASLPLIISLAAARSCSAPICARPPPDCHYQADADGCPTCNLICNPASCPPLRCARPCYNGYIKDEKGCNTCNCRSGCYKRACPNDCPHGAYLDSVGCPTCQCKPQPLSCHRDVAPLCTRGVCPNACACKPFCYPSPNDGGVRTGNTVNDFWNLIFASRRALPSGNAISDVPSFFRERKLKI